MNHRLNHRRRVCTNIQNHFSRRYFIGINTIYSIYLRESRKHEGERLIEFLHVLLSFIRNINFLSAHNAILYFMLSFNALIN